MRNADAILWTGGFFNERFPAPVSPLGWSLLGPLIEELALRDPLRYLGYDAENIPLVRLWHGHPYANALVFQILYKAFPDFILPEDASRYFPGGDVSQRKRAPYPHSLLSPRLLLSLLRTFLSDPLNVSPLNNYRRWTRYTREHDLRVAALRARLEALSRAEPVEILAALGEAERTHRDLLRIHRWSLIDADLTFGLLKRLVRAWVADREHADETAARLVSGVPNKTLEVDSALRDLAKRARAALANPADYESFVQNVSHDTLEAFRTFLIQHGHRSFSLDIAVPTFAEDPMQVVRLLFTVSDQGRMASDESASSVLRPLAIWQRASFNAVLALARQYVALREDQRYYWQKSLAVSRHLYLLLADRLVAEGVIADRDAVSFATHQELEDHFGARLAKDALAKSIAARQVEWREYAREFERSPTTSYPQLLRGDVPVARSETDFAPGLWHGRAVSPGSARGVARVVQSASELTRVQSGEILVAPATDPAWTPVFARIAGLVVERGGVLSHSAVVAREYGIPAVAGIPDIVNAIRDGEVIEVDGSAGRVARVQR